MNFFRKKISQAHGGTSNSSDSGSKQTETVKIEVQTPSVVTLREDYQLPLIYNSAAVPTHLAALITFETPHNYAADEIEILFSASENSQWQEVKRFSKHRWTLPVTKIPSSDLNNTTNTIAPGRYTRLIQAALDPTWPSSCFHPSGSIRYTLHLRALSKSPPKTLATQDVWVIHRNVPAHLDTDDPLQQPYAVEDLWKKRTLPVSVALPSQYLSPGQVVPVTVTLSAFLHGSKFEGQVAHVVGAQFVVQEASPMRMKNAHDPATTPTKEVLALALNGWPSSVNGCERTVHLTLPGTPAMALSLEDGVLDVYHQLVVTLKVRTGGAKQVEEFKVSLKIQIVGPKPESNYMLDGQDEAQVPHYSDVSPPQDGHPGEELPSYAQTEP
ncbi:hypothetical protein BG003_002164 [Podila horticola]|nr:hypothetical protein BG003_002164 [Podila horticola]